MPYTQILADAPTPVLAPGAEERKSRRRLIEALALQGTSGAPVGHWTEGLNRIAQAGLSGLEEGKLRKEERAQEERIAAALAGLPALGGGSQAADVQDPATARAPDGMDRSISVGPRSPFFSPVTTEPPEEPSPYKVAGMPSPTNSQDTFRTPLDMMAPREQGLAALRTAMGGQPPMTGATPPGAIPVQTQAIRPPAPDAMPPNATPTQGMLPQQPAASPAIDPASAKYIQGLMANPQTRQFGMQLYQSLLTKSAGEKPTWGKLYTDPATGSDVMGWIDARQQKVTPYQVPGGQQQAGGEGAIPPPPPGADPKKWREKMTEQFIGKQAGQPQKERAANIVIGDIDRAIDIATKSPMTATGAGGQILQNFGGTQARDLSGLVDTIKANSSFDRLQQMREASPTGAALGAVSDTELRLLGAAIGSLDQSQTQKQFIENMRRVRKIYSDVINGPGGGGGGSERTYNPQTGRIE